MNLRLRHLSHPHKKLAVRGVTLIEALVTIAVVGLLASVAAANVTKLGSKPLPDTANTIAGVLRSARARAIAQTSPIKIKPKNRQAVPNGTSMGGLNTQFEMMRAKSTNVACNDEASWGSDPTLSEDYLTFGKANVPADKKITLQVTQVNGAVLNETTGWEICFNPRGMVSTTSTSVNNFVGDNIVLTFQEGTNPAVRRRVEIFPAGGVQVYDN